MTSFLALSAAQEVKCAFVWINVEVLQMVCQSNNIDCSGLERTDVEPFEWLCCVYDDGFPGAPALQECNWAFRDGGLEGPAVSAPAVPAKEEAGAKKGRKKTAGLSKEIPIPGLQQDPERAKVENGVYSAKGA
eukprot:g9038.t1